MIVFECIQEGDHWKVLRNNKLVCYYTTLDNARKAVDRFAQNILAQGGQVLVRTSDDTQASSGLDIVPFSQSSEPRRSY